VNGDTVQVHYIASYFPWVRSKFSDIEEGSKGKNCLPGQEGLNNVNCFFCGPVEIEKSKASSQPYDWKCRLSHQLQVVDTSHTSDSTNGKAFEFVVGAGKVIKGWDVGLPFMSLGMRSVLRVPPAYFGYGDKAKGVIPANTTLDFDMELIKVRDIWASGFDQFSNYCSFAWKRHFDWDGVVDVTEMDRSGANKVLKALSFLTPYPYSCWIFYKFVR